MRLPLVSDTGLAQAIRQATYNLQHPEEVIKRYALDPKMRDGVMETQLLHLSMMLELQHRREVDGPLPFTGFDVLDVPE